VRQTDHLSREELERLIAFTKQGKTSADPKAAHAVDCAECRFQLRSLLLEQQPTTALLFDREEDDEFATCLQPDEALRYVRNQGDALEQETIGFHIEECSACRTLITTLQAFAVEVERLPLPRVSSERPGADPAAQVRQALNRGVSWLRQLGAQAASALETMRPTPTAYGFSAQKRENPRQILEFSDPEITGSYRAESAGRLLHLEHASCKPGTLVLLEAQDELEQVAWRGFAVFRQGMRRAVLDIAADASADLRTLHVGLLSPAQLNPEIGAELPKALSAQLDREPAARAAWETWAQQAVAEAPDADVRTMAAAMLTQLANE
jgi:hypothetical protein